MAPQSSAVRLAGSTIDCRCHACAFVDSREEEYEVLLPFMKEVHDVQLPKYDTVTYDVMTFSTSFPMDILRTPSAIVGGVLQQNSFYVPPDQFLEELHSARSH
jgi:hypothetical protein